MTELEKRIEEVTAEIKELRAKPWYQWDITKEKALDEELADLLDRYAGIK